MTQQERRKSEDRRARCWKRGLFNFRRLHGRRHQLRRATDHQIVRGGQLAGYYVDRYEPTLLYLVVATLVLCSLDAFFTLELLKLGAVEANKVMDYLIRKDIMWFVAGKFALTSLGLIFLVSHYKFHLWGNVRVIHMLHGLFIAYLCLIGYELLLLIHI